MSAVLNRRGWRTRQFEYAWQRTLTQSYADFWGVTQDALVVACAAHGVALSADARDRLLDAYLHPGLARCAAGARGVEVREDPDGLVVEFHREDAGGERALSRAPSNLS